MGHGNTPLDGSLGESYFAYDFRLTFSEEKSLTINHVGRAGNVENNAGVVESTVHHPEIEFDMRPAELQAL